MIIVRQAQRQRPHERRLIESERLTHVSFGDAERRRFAFIDRERPQIAHRDAQWMRLQRARRLDDQRRLPVAGDNPHPQRFLATRHQVQRPLQRRHIETPAQPHHLRDVVERAPRLQLVEKPEPLLRKRQREAPSVARLRADRRRSGCPS
jgi:hypothetical protein